MGVKDEIAFEEARKQLVVKRVDAIQLGRNSFTLVEQKAINYMISKIKPEDRPTKEYKFNISEFCRMIQWHRTPTYEMLDMLRNLANKSWWIKSGEDGKAEYELRHWFDIVTLNEGKGTITITFSQTVQPYLFDLLEQQRQGNVYLASWTADAISLMKNKFAPRLFELLRTYQFNNEKWEFELGTGSDRDIHVIIADRNAKGEPVVPKSWNKWYTFKRDVLEPAKEDINKYTDLLIDYEGVKTDFNGEKSRNYVRVIFKLEEKTEEQKKRKDQDIAIAYDNVISEREYEQLSFLDYANSIEERGRLVSQMTDSSELKKIINTSKHPRFFEAMAKNGFDIKYIDSIYNLASAKFVLYARTVGDENEESWITDYVLLHLNSMRCSGVQTVSNEMARLYDLVENDYKHYAVEVSRKYYNPIPVLHDEETWNGNIRREERSARRMDAPIKLSMSSAMTDEDAELADMLLSKLKKDR